MQLLWSSPVKHYECVNQVKSTNAVPIFSFFGYKLEMSCRLKWGKITFGEKCSIGYGQSIHFSKHYITFRHYIMLTQIHYYVTALSGEDRRLRRKTNHVLWQSVHTLFKLTFKKPRRNQMFFWWFMFSFYLKAEKCLKKYKCNRC